MKFYTILNNIEVQDPAQCDSTVNMQKQGFHFLSDTINTWIFTQYSHIKYEMPNIRVIEEGARDPIVAHKGQHVFNPAEENNTQATICTLSRMAWRTNSEPYFAGIAGASGCASTQTHTHTHTPPPQVIWALQVALVGASTVVKQHGAKHLLMCELTQ